MPGAVFLDAREAVRLDQCVIEHVGNYGIEVGEGCTDVAITHNRITDLGGGGVKIGTTDSCQRTDGGGQRNRPRRPHSS